MISKSNRKKWGIKKIAGLVIATIPNCRQFHQRFTHVFFVQIFCQSQNVPRNSCQNDVRTKNLYVKMLMKLTPGLLGHTTAL